MGLENANYIDELNEAWPIGNLDTQDESDNHHRVIKNAVKGSFPNLGLEAVTLTAAQINALITYREKPIGALEFGYNPNGVLPGTWLQLPEGAFLMNTVANSDNGGGANRKALVEANIPSHTHPVSGINASQGTHTHTVANVGIRVGNGPTDDAGSDGPDSMGSLPTDAVSPAITVGGSVVPNPAHVASTFDNRPLYEGVAIWKRTA